MVERWDSDHHPTRAPFDARDWVRIVRRGLPIGILIFGGLIVLLLIRLIEVPLYGKRRCITPYITQFVCRNVLRIMGLRYDVRGKIMQGPGAVVANHISWLDIFSLNAAKRIYFVSKAEVAAWPGIGWLARATGTVFIKRDRRDALAQVGVFQTRLESGHKLLFFPEGTSTDGQQVVTFKPTLLAAFFAGGLRETMRIQAVTVVYHAAPDQDPRFYGWWGSMDFGPHLLTVLAAKHQGRVQVRYHAPVNVKDYSDRKALAADLEVKVRDGLSDNRGP